MSLLKYEIANRLEERAVDIRVISDFIIEENSQPQQDPSSEPGYLETREKATPAKNITNPQ